MVITEDRAEILHSARLPRRMAAEAVAMEQVQQRVPLAVRVVASVPRGLQRLALLLMALVAVVLVVLQQA